MSKTLIIGATGQIGRILVNKMGAAQRPFCVAVRNLSAGTFDGVVETRHLDLEVALSRAAFEGCDNIVFTAGSGASTGFDKTLLIDLWAAAKVINIAKECGIGHFIMVSSRGALDPDNGPERIKPYLVAKHFADNHLRQSGVPHTILQPGRLLNEPATGSITTVRPTDPAAQVISREDVAEVIVQCLQRKDPMQNTLELFNGERPIAEVVQRGIAMARRARN